MRNAASAAWPTPRQKDLGLRRIVNRAGLSVSVLPNAALFAIEHHAAGGTILVNQVLASPIEGGVGRIYLRLGGAAPSIVEAVGPRAGIALGGTEDRLVWDGETHGIRHRVTLKLQPDDAAWLWHVQVLNARDTAIPLDALLVQDIGLGLRAFLTNNEAYASQYIDHHIARHPRYGPVVMCRQNLAQDSRHPWVVHGSLDGAKGYATDAMQVFGPAYRNGNAIDARFGVDLPGRRLQHELACTAIQSLPATLEPGAQAAWRFFGLYVPDHRDASSDADMQHIDAIRWQDPESGDVALAAPVRSFVQDAPPVLASPLRATALAERYPVRLHEEHVNGSLLSFFTPDPPHNRHVVLRDKERIVARRHGTLLRTGQSMLPDDATLCATAWMHGVFGAQLTIGNTSFHKLFSVSRDPYNIMRTSGLRMLVDAGDGWRLLTVPSAFEMGLSDCRWIYCLDARTVTVRAIASGEDPAMQWRVDVEGAPCRFLIFAHVVLGERELEQDAAIEVDSENARFTFRPDPASLWGERYPRAVYHFVTGSREAVEAIGGDELLYADGRSRRGAYVAMRTLATREFRFAVVGSLTQPRAAARLAAKYEHRIDDVRLLAPAMQYWTRITRGARITGERDGATALDTLLPWLAHNAIIHLTVPHGLEQYTGAAWGTRDVCQGPVEFLLALEHDEPVKDILRIVFAQQYDNRGDWPQWFMLEPYSAIQDRSSHGDVIVWPLKALNDYIEATNDLSFLDEPIPWRGEETLERTAQADPVTRHVEKLLTTVRENFIPGTHLIRYGEGDWNDSLQPADHGMREWMVSSWTVALLFQQVERYAEVMHRAGRENEGAKLKALAETIARDFNRFLIRDGTVAGYALFEPGAEFPELLIHPTDTRTGLHYSLLPMTRSIIAGLFTPEQARHHLRLMREHLLFPDGVRLIDRPVAYRGGPERVFRRAESSSFFGREIGLMYVHAHLRYGEAMAALGEVDALWEALEVASPITVTERLAHATPRQRNAYFSSSDAAFHDRYEASADWARVKAGTVPVDGGWRIYSSGPGLYTNLLLCHAFGIRRRWGTRHARPLIEGATLDFLRK